MSDGAKKNIMLRKKEPKVIITFYTTSGAIEMEKACKEAGAAGRMIPVPRELSAGCGLAWCAPSEEKERLEAILAEKKLDCEAVTEMMY